MADEGKADLAARNIPFPGGDPMKAGPMKTGPMKTGIVPGDPEGAAHVVGGRGRKRLQDYDADREKEERPNGG